MRVKSDFLILGSGIAGLSLALKAAKLGHVTILTKTLRSEGATRYAQGGIAAVFSEQDSFESHIKDTMEAGAGLCNLKTVEITVREGPARVQELIDIGVPFTKRMGEPASVASSRMGETAGTRALDGTRIIDNPDLCPYDLTREGGHRARRILHADDFTGRAIHDSLLKAVAEHPNISVLEHHIAIDLITSERMLKHGGAGGSATGVGAGTGGSGTSSSRSSHRQSSGRTRCFGTYALDIRTNKIHAFSAAFTVLATGGAGKVYLYTSNPDTATGDGISIAHRAGARVANLEFMQFHPTCLYNPEAKSFLISEALRGEGGVLINREGQAFMKNYHPMGNLAPRDIVARAIDSEMKRSGADCVYLDMTKIPAEALIKRFPNIYDRCMQFGIDLTRQPIPVVPAAHYMCGGVLSDEWGESTIRNLFVVGETAHTGLHGANRLASNSLLEGVVFADRAFKRMQSRFENMRGSTPALEDMPEHLPEWDSGMAVPMEERINIAHTWKEIRTLMWNYVGIVRTTRRLEKAQARLALIRHEVSEYYWKYLLTPDLIELRNLVTLADLIVQAALWRKESRGLHYNLDYPAVDDVHYKTDTIL